jgi:osmotically-inducible protein OsmY
MLIGLSLACSGPNREKAEENEAKARQETRTLANKAKTEAQDLGRKIDAAVQPNTDTAQAQAKLQDGKEKLEDAGQRAAVKLDRAAIEAKVKAKLVNDVGLKTLTGVDVDSAGETVTLRGVVSSEAQKEQAGQAAASVEGVRKVVNELRVEN